MAIWLLSKDGSKLAYDIGIGVNSTSFISRMFLLGLVFVLGFWFTLGLGCVGNDRFVVYDEWLWLIMIMSTVNNNN